MSVNEEKIVRYLEEHVGDRTTSLRLLSEIGEACLNSLNSIKLHYEVLAVAKTNGFMLDMSEHAGKEEGMPYDLDFVIRKTDRKDV